MVVLAYRPQEMDNANLRSVMATPGTAKVEPEIFPEGLRRGSDCSDVVS